MREIQEICSIGFAELPCLACAEIQVRFGDRSPAGFDLGQSAADAQVHERVDTKPERTPRQDFAQFESVPIEHDTERQ